MTTVSLHTLFNPTLRRRIALLAALALCVGGIVQAAHFHKSEPLRGADVHLQCLLCAHADRAAAPPVLPRVVQTPLWLVQCTSEAPPGSLPTALARPYQARAPPAA